MKNYSPQKANYQFKILLFGTLLTCFGIYQLQESIVIKSRMIALTGIVGSARTYEYPIRNKYGVESHKCELVFYLKEHKKKFSFVRNTGDATHDEAYEQILNKLNRADSVSVWIRRRDVEEYQPKVFRITNGGEEILTFDAVTYENRGVTFLLLVLGIGSLLFYGYSRNPAKWNRILKI